VSRTFTTRDKGDWMSAFRTMFLLSAALANSALAASPRLSISLKHGDAKERATQSQLERLPSQDDLTPWIFIRLTWRTCLGASPPKTSNPTCSRD
jgi:hypothetical protein